MSKLKRRWPFSLVPYYWGLPPELKEKEKIKYYYDGKTRDDMLLELEFPKDIDKESLDYRKAKLHIEKEYNKISPNVYEKEMATLNKKPYFKILSGDVSFNGRDTQMTFELDWNTIFVEQLIADGWEGFTEDQVVNKWFEDSCSQMLQDDYDDPQGMTQTMDSN